MPSLDAAMQAINTIEKTELMELRAMKTPPEIAVQTMEAISILLGLKPDWSTAKSLLGDPSFLQTLSDFDKVSDFSCFLEAFLYFSTFAGQHFGSHKQEDSEIY